MDIRIAEFIEQAGLKEPLYPGKRLVQLCAVGPFKSHCIVYDWRDPSNLSIEIRAGTTGNILPLKDLQKYPVSFQAPTRVVIEIANDDEETEGKKGKAGGSGKRAPKKKASMGFARSAEGKIPGQGTIVEMIVMGKEITKEAYGIVMETLTSQIEKLKVAPTDLLAKTTDLVTRYTPPSFLQPKGNEQAVYEYDRGKNEQMFGISPG